MRDRSKRRHTDGSFRRGSAARTGLLVALGMGVVSAGVVTYFVTSGPRRTRGADQSAGETPPQTPTADPQNARSGRGGLTVGAGKGLSVQVASRSDPTRLAGTITSRTLEPLEANRYTAERPESFIYLRDGRTIFVRADSARLYIPQSSSGQPESGTLNGHVEIWLFDRRAGGVDPARDTPSLKLNTEQFTFDLTAWEFFMPDEVRIVGPTLSYTGSKLRLLLNQPEERVELLHIARSKELRLRSTGRSGEVPGTAAGSEAKQAAAAPASTTVAAAGSTQAPPTAASPDKASATAETFYRTVLTDTVRVAQNERSIEADTLNLWAHLVGGQLPPNAIAPVRRSDPAPRPAATPASAPTTVAAAPAPAPAPKSIAAEEDADLVITWAGPLEMRPLDARPAELAHDDVSLRFTSTAAAPVRFAENAKDASGLSGVASRIDYGATSRSIALASDEPEGVRIDLSRSGRLRCTSLDLNLGDGLAMVNGAGSVTGVVGTGFTETPAPISDRAEDRLVRWSDGAEFRFVTGENGLGGALLSAAMFGEVEAIDGGSSLRGNALAANFFDGTSRTGPISRLVVLGNAEAQDARDGALFCDRLDASFRRREGSPEQSDPSWITASGSAMAVRGGEVLGAELIETSIERDAQGKPQVAEMIADGNAVYEQSDGVWAIAPEIRASATRRTAALSGDGARVGKGGSSVSGTQIELDGDARLATVFGAGSFSHHGPDAQGRPLDADASWTRSMTFDDRSGILEARGATHATIRPDPWTVRELDAGTVRIELTPGTSTAGLDPGAKPEAPAAGESRRVLRAEAIGASLDVEGGGRAVITSRSYEAADVPEGRRLAEELRLEGDRILADDERGTVDVPSAGVLRIVDVRAAPSGEHAAPDGTRAPDLNARGAARFEWTGSLYLDRVASTATMKQGVRLRHLPLDRSEMTELEGEEVVAHMSDLQNDGTGGAVRGRLVRASATGAVWARLGDKELTADRLEYLTTERLIRAASNGENEVVMVDSTKPTPMKAKLLEWDLARDRVEIKSPGTIVIPR